MIDTHYFVRPPVLDPTAFVSFSAEVRRLIDAAEKTVAIRGAEGTGKPEANERRIALNGDASKGLEHEPLIIEQTYTIRPPSRLRDGVFNDFCKTNGKPYDTLVVAVLYAFIHRFPTVKFVSDSKLEELKPGFDLFFSTCELRGDMQKLFSRPVAEKESR